MILLLHGFLGTPRDWGPLTKHLTSPYKTLTLPGHLGTPFDLTFLEKAITEKVTLVGYSLGGRLAMDFARKYPEKIKRLVILSANPGLESGREERVIQDEKWISIIENEGIDRFLNQWYAQPLFSSFSFNKEMKKRRRMHDPKAICLVLRELSPAKLPSLWPYLKEFSFPMLFLFGENDIKYKAIGGKLMKNFDVKWIPDVSHPIHIEAPTLVAKLINGRSYDLNS